MQRIGKFLSRRSSWSIPYVLFMVIFVVLPLILIVGYAFTDADGHFTLGNFTEFLHQKEAINTFVYSIFIAALTTAICILLGYPAAYILALSKDIKAADIIVVLFLVPMLINVLMRTIASVALFDWLGIPLGQGTLVAGMVYNFIPFMILPIFNQLKKIDPSFMEAAQDLGAKPVEVFTKVILPLSKPGVVSGVMMVFMPTISTFAISELLTLNKIQLFGTIIQQNINNGLWNYGAMLALIMLVIIIVSNIFTEDEGNMQETVL